MKFINHKLFLAALCLSAAALTSCSDDEKYDIDGTNDAIVYFTPTVKQVYSNQVMRTAVGVLGAVRAQIPVNVQKKTSGNIDVTAVADTTLVNAYNKENNTTCEQFPEKALAALQVENASIAAGNMKDTMLVSLPLDVLDQFTASSYVLPVRLQASGDGVRASQDYDVAYIVVNTKDVDNFVTLDKNKIDCNIIKTPVGTFGGVDDKIKVSIAGAVNADWSATAVADNSLIAAYNEENGTDYQALPDDVLKSLTITPEVIKAGETTNDEGIKVNIPVEKLKSLSQSYLVPLKVTSTYGDKTIAEDDDIVYMTIGVKETLINDDAKEFKGTAATDHSAWTVKDCENLNPENYEGLFDTGWNGGWAFNGKASSAKFTLDLGAKHKLAGFYVESYVMKNCKVEISTDGSNWVSLGDTKDHSPFQKYDASSWEYISEYVLYGAVDCRYIRYTFDLDTGSWAWNYGSYAKVSGFKVFLND